MQWWKHWIGVIICTFALPVLAASEIAKEETTPPPPEGALQLEDIPPIVSLSEESPAPENPT